LPLLSGHVDTLVVYRLLLFYYSYAKQTQTH
jgi:hypothetical protein